MKAGYEIGYLDPGAACGDSGTAGSPELLAQEARAHIAPCYKEKAFVMI